MLQLILAPSKGWEDISATNTPVPVLVKGCLYPLITVAALSVFMKYIYNPEIGFLLSLVKSLVVFVSYFVTFYFACVMFKSFFYRFCEGAPNEHKYTTVLAYTISLLGLSATICNLLPVSLGLKYLFPLAVALIMWKSDIYLRVRQDRYFVFILFCILVAIVPPTLIQSLFDLIL